VSTPTAQFRSPGYRPTQNVARTNTKSSRRADLASHDFSFGSPASRSGSHRLGYSAATNQQSEQTGSEMSIQAVCGPGWGTGGSSQRRLSPSAAQALVMIGKGRVTGARG